MRVRRVAGIFVFALAIALGLMLQATDPSRRRSTTPDAG